MSVAIKGDKQVLLHWLSATRDQGEKLVEPRVRSSGRDVYNYIPKPVIQVCLTGLPDVRQVYLISDYVCLWL